MAEAMAVTGLTTKKATVEEALRRLVRHHHRRVALDDMAGLGWEGDLDAMREGRILWRGLVIVVDSSAWIAYPPRHGQCQPPSNFATLLRDDSDQILIGDLILLEVVQGARDDDPCRPRSSRLFGGSRSCAIAG